jgi:LuxR family transcriptional regulator, maltose regulon positive regulatory protein
MQVADDGQPRASLAPRGPYRRVRPSGRSLIPQPPASVVSRDHLLRALSAAATKRVTLVCAGPGWGKTVAVADWLTRDAGAPRVVAWHTLEKGDDNPGAFWEVLLTALKDAGVITAGDRLATMSPSAGVSTEFLSSFFAALATLPAPVLLVLDDFHVVEDPRVLHEVAELVTHAGLLRLLLITRFDPVLGLHRLRLTGELAELRSEDLAFGPADVAALAGLEHVALSDDENATLLERTDGWPAGVRLALLHLESAPAAPHRVDDFVGTERSVADYFVGEVLARKTPEMRDFLLRTAVADRLSGDLADAIVPGGRGQARLEELTARNEFVTVLGTNRHWFRYHPLFRDLLRHVLRRDHPLTFRDAHRATALWLGEHGEAMRALEHAAAAEDWELTGDIFVRAAAPALLGAQRESLRRVLSSLPYQHLPESAPVLLCACGLALAAGDFGALPELMARARRLLDGNPKGAPEGADVLLHVISCVIARAGGHPAAILEAAEKGLAALDSSEKFPAWPVFRVVVRHNLAIGLLLTGRTEAAREEFARTLKEPPASEQIEYTRLSAGAYLSLCDLVEGRLDEAQEQARETTADAEQRGWSSLLQVRPAYVVMALVAVLRGEDVDAERALAAALAADVGGEEWAATLLLRVTQTYLGVSRQRVRSASVGSAAVGELAQGRDAPRFLADAVTRAKTSFRVLAGDPATAPTVAATADQSDTERRGARPSATELACRARLELARGSHEAAVAAAKRAAAAPTLDLGDLLAHVEARLTLALAADGAGRRHEALTWLREAIDAARPRGLVWPFVVTESPQLARLLRAHIETTLRRDPFLDRLMARALVAPAPGDEPEPLLEALTQRELAVLAELPSMKSNDEIARDLFVSVNTVKAHLKGLYRKLGVSTRREAVRRARDHGLLG